MNRLELATIDLSADELLAALDSFTTRDFSKAWVDRFSFHSFRDAEGPLSEEEHLLTWANGTGISLAFRGLVDIEIDRGSLKPRIDRLIVARGARQDPDAVSIALGRVAASARLLVAELARRGDRSSTSYYVVWTKTAEGWAYHSLEWLSIACG